MVLKVLNIDSDSQVIIIMAMPARRYAFGRADEATHPDSMRATLSEFLSTLIFVFAGEGSVLAIGKASYTYN